jgi:hypothetical protein
MTVCSDDVLGDIDSLHDQQMQMQVWSTAWDSGIMVTFMMEGELGSQNEQTQHV